MERVFLSIGANLGQKQKTCEQAVTSLGEIEGVQVVAQSDMFVTEPQGVLEQPEFINLAVELMTDLPASNLLEATQMLEKNLGRTPGERWGPRIIDLDLLLYGSLVFDEPNLVLPHPRMHERRFVLAPLAQIAPDVQHPVLNKTIDELLKSLGTSGGRVRVM